MKLSMWSEIWLDQRIDEVAESTREKNAYHCRHIQKGLGKMELTEIHFSDIENFYSELDLAQNTIRAIHGTLSKCLADAARSRDTELHQNPCSEARTPQQETQTFDVLSMAEAKRLRGELYVRNPYDAVIFTALVTGMRRSEILGLTWDHLDLDRGVIQIRQTLTKTPRGSFRIGPPKSKSSRRAVSLGPNVCDELRIHKDVQLKRQVRAEEWPEEDLVFTSHDGTKIYPSNLRRRFLKVLDECDIEPIRFHDLRHTHATILLQRDEHPEKVKDRLGHGSVKITLDRYSHVNPSMQDGLAESFSEAIF